MVPSCSLSSVLFPAPPCPVPSPTSPAWKSIPTAREVPDTGTRASDLSLGSRGMPRIPSCTEYRRKEPTPVTQVQGQSDTSKNPQAVPPPRKTVTGEEHGPGRGGCNPFQSPALLQGGTSKAPSHQSPPPLHAGKGSRAHLGQGSTCYSAPALTQMVQSSANPSSKPLGTLCTQTAFERPWQCPGGRGSAEPGLCLALLPVSQAHCPQ